MFSYAKIRVVENSEKVTNLFSSNHSWFMNTAILHCFGLSCFSDN
jgi:hypothetical protein